MKRVFAVVAASLLLLCSCITTRTIEIPIVDLNQSAAMAQQAYTSAQQHYMIAKLLGASGPELLVIEKQVDQRREFVLALYEEISNAN